MGQFLSVEVSGNGASLLSPISSAPVANVNDAPTGDVLVAGLIEAAPREDSALSLDLSNLSDADGLGDPSYQWLLDGEAIAAATSANFTPGDAQVGGELSLQLRYRDGGGTEEELITPLGLVGGVDDPTTGSLELDGLSLGGQILTVVDRLDDADGITTRSYLWERSTDGGQSWSAISSAQSDPDIAGYGSYQLDARDDAGNLVRVTATYTDQQGHDHSYSSAPSSRILSRAKEGSQLQQLISDPTALLQWRQGRQPAAAADQ